MSQKNTASKKQVPLSAKGLTALLNDVDSAFEILQNKDKKYLAQELIAAEQYLKKQLMPEIDKRQKDVEAKLYTLIDEEKTKAQRVDKEVGSKAIQKITEGVFKQLNNIVDKQHEYQKLTLQKVYNKPIKNFDTLNPFQKRTALQNQHQQLEKNTKYQNALAELKQDQEDYKVKLKEDWQVATLNQKEIGAIQNDIVKGFAGLFDNTDRVNTLGAIKNILQQKSKKEGDYLVPFNKLGKVDKLKLIPKLIGDVVGKTKFGTTTRLLKSIPGFVPAVISMDANQQADDPEFWKKFVENDAIWNGITDIMHDPKIRVDRVLGNLLGTALFKEGGALDARGSKLLSDFIVSDKDKIRELVLDGLEIAVIAKQDPKLAQNEVIKRDIPGKAIDLIESSSKAKAFFQERSGMLVNSFIDTIYANSTQSEGLSSLRKLTKARKEGKELLNDVGLTPKSAKQLGGIVPILLKDENFTAFKKIYEHVKEADFIKVAHEMVNLTENTPEIATYLRNNQELMTNLANNVFSKIPELQKLELKQDLLDIVPKLLEHPKELKQIINSAGKNDINGMTKAITDFVSKAEISEYLGKQGKDATSMALKAFALDKGVNPDVITILAQVTTKENLNNINDIVSDFAKKDSNIMDKMRGSSKLLQLLHNDKTIKTYFAQHKQDLAKLIDFALSNVPEASKHLGNAQIGKFAATMLESVVSIGSTQVSQQEKSTDLSNTEITHSKKNIDRMSEIIKLATNLDSMSKVKDLITKSGSVVLSNALDAAKKDERFAQTWDLATKRAKSVYDTAKTGAKVAYSAASAAGKVVKEGMAVAKDYASRDLQTKKQHLANQMIQNITSKPGAKKSNLSSAIKNYVEKDQFADEISALYKKDQKQIEQFKDLTKTTKIQAQNKDRLEKFQDLAKNNKLFEGVIIKSSPNKPISFKNFNIDGINFRNAVLENVSFNNTKITEADFSNTKFTNVNFKGAEIDGKTLSSMVAQLQDNKISLNGVKITGTIPEGTDLKNIDFKGVDLSELKSLKGIDLQGVDFSANNTIKDQVISTGYNFQTTKVFEATAKDTNVINDIADRIYPNKLNPQEAALRQDLRDMYMSDSKIGKYLRTNLSADIEDIKKTDLSQQFDDKKLNPYKTGTFMLMIKKHQGNHESFKQELTAHIFADYLIDDLQPKFVDKETFSAMKNYIAQSLEKANIKPEALLANQERFVQAKELINNAIKADVEKNNAWVNKEKTNIVTARYDDEDISQTLISDISKAMDQAASLSVESHRFIKNVTNKALENNELSNDLLQDKDKLEFKQKIFDSVFNTLHKNNVDIKELNDNEVKKLQEDFSKQINNNVKVQIEEKKIPGYFYGHTITQEAKIASNIESIENNLSNIIKAYDSSTRAPNKNTQQQLLQKKDLSKIYKTHAKADKKNVHKSHTQLNRQEMIHSQSHKRDDKTIANENTLAKAEKIVADFRGKIKAKKMSDLATTIESTSDDIKKKADYLSQISPAKLDKLRLDLDVENVKISDKNIAFNNIADLEVALEFNKNKKILEEYNKENTNKASKLTQYITPEEVNELKQAKKTLQQYSKKIDVQKAITTPIKPKKDVEISHDGNLKDNIQQALSQALKNKLSKTDVQKKDTSDQKTPTKDIGNLPARDSKMSKAAKKIKENLQKASEQRSATASKPHPHKPKRLAKKALSWGRK